MAQDIVFPDRRPPTIVETRLMREIQNRTMAAHPDSPIVVWTGPQRIGKTVTATWMRDRINEAFARRVENSFRAERLQVGRASKLFGQEDKKVIRTVYHALIGRMDEGDYRRKTVEDLAHDLVYALQKKHVEMVFVDEAGLLCLDAIDGLVLVRDTAVAMGHTLTLVLIGMDDLPPKLGVRPQVSGRVAEWCYFEPYSLEDTRMILARLHHHFAELDKTNPEHEEQVQWVHKTLGGIPGELQKYLTKLSAREKPGVPINLMFLRAVHTLTDQDHTRAVVHASRGFKGPPPTVDGKPEESPEEPKPRRKAKRGGRQAKTAPAKRHKD